MHVVWDFIDASSAYFILGLTCACLLLLVYSAVLARRVRRLSRRRNQALDAASLDDLLDHLSRQTEAGNELRARVDEIDRLHGQQACDSAACLQNIGIVRFNAFEDVGGEQSFAVAILDENSSGLVISSLHGRQDSRLYAKTVTRGRGERALSDEELAAVESALAEHAQVSD